MSRNVYAGNNISFPWFLKGLAPDLVHLPSNDVPLLIQHRYVVTIHDMSSFLFGGRTGTGEDLRLYRFRRGLSVPNALSLSPPPRAGMSNIFSASAPNESARSTALPILISWSGLSTNTGRRLLERFSIHHPYIFYAGRIRPHKNIPRLIEAFAVVRGELRTTLYIRICGC